MEHCRLCPDPVTDACQPQCREFRAEVVKIGPKNSPQICEREGPKVWRMDSVKFLESVAVLKFMLERTALVQSRVHLSELLCIGSLQMCRCFQQFLRAISVPRSAADAVTRLDTSRYKQPWCRGALETLLLLQDCRFLVCETVVVEGQGACLT